MQPSEGKSDNLHVLRRRVRRVMQRLNFSALNDPYDLSPTPADHLLRRLHLYQLEIEMQKDLLQRTQSALDSSRARYIDLLAYTSALYDDAPAGYLTLTEGGTIVEANLVAVELLELRRELLLQQPLSQFIVEDDRGTFRAFCAQVQAGEQAQRCELRMMRADGSSFFVQLDATVTEDIFGAGVRDAAIDERQPTPSHQGPYLRIVVSDISARIQVAEDERKTRAELEATLLDLRQTQEQMVRQERLAVVGQLAAGVAHDFNNIIASITLYAQLALRGDDLSPTLQKRMEAIVSQSERAAHLVQQILDFGRRTDMVRQATALCRFLREFVEMLRQSLPDTIEVSLDLSNLQPGVDDVVDLDSGRMQQILLNLALNARDAMPDGGYLNIVLTRVTVDEDVPALTSGTLAPGAWLQIALNDSGTGIRAEDIPHLFEPFFTTKGIGQGSGLGLSQVWGLVKQHDGEIDVTSVLGKGSNFNVYLPASTATPAMPASPSAKQVPRGHGEMILVVEDSDFLRMAVISAVTQLGYASLAARHGQEAFDLMIKEGEKVDLILSDLSMPIMGGKELIRAVRAQGWQQPIVVLTGQPLSAEEVEHLQSYGRVARMQKPAAIDRLAFALHHALTHTGD